MTAAAARNCAARVSTVGKIASQVPEPPREGEAESGGGYPAGELQLLGALADHHHEHEADHGAREHQHSLVGELVMGDEGQHARPPP